MNDVLGEVLNDLPSCLSSLFTPGDHTKTEFDRRDGNASLERVKSLDLPRVLPKILWSGCP